MPERVDPAQSSTRIEYRLTFETVDSNWAAHFEDSGGKYEHLWDEGDWDTLPWLPPVTRITGDADIHGQHAQLKRWADSHEQPIRNVRLERRQMVVVEDEGWDPVDG